MQPTTIRSERPRSVTQKQSRVAAPTGGLNFIDSTMDFPASDAYILDNIIPKPYGCEIRKGWQNWFPTANKFAGAVNTVLAFSAEKSANSRLFASAAANPSKIYNITTPNAAPVLSLTPSTNSDNQGEWYYTNFVTIAGNFMIAVSAGAGVYQFSCPAGVDTWTEVVTGAGAGQIAFPSGSALTTKDICFVWVWKNRIWFLVRNSATAYYLPVSQMAGQLNAFDFGQQLTLGGSLLWATNWTYDAGDGIDDSLILASDQGQVLVYEGTDPDSAQAFKKKGAWFAGRFPSGRRNYAAQGGDVLFLSEYGIISVADMVSGKLHTAGLSGSVGYKVNPKISGLITGNISTSYWFLQPYATEEMLYLGTPIVDDNGLTQDWGMYSLNNAWCTFSNMPTLCACVWQGAFIFGDSTGMVSRGFTNYVDGLSSDGTTTPGNIVTARIQGAFADYDTPNLNKRMLRIKMYGRSTSDPTFYARYLKEYDLTTILSAPNPPTPTGSVWDTAIWDVSTWGISGLGSFHKWFGVTGYGKKLSLQIALRGSGQTIYTDHEALHEVGIGL